MTTLLYYAALLLGFVLGWGACFTYRKATRRREVQLELLDVPPGKQVVIETVTRWNADEPWGQA